MKKRHTVLIVIAALLASLLIWRLWPHSASFLLPDDQSDVTGFYAGAAALEFKNGEHHFISYTIEDSDLSTDAMEDLLTILKTSRYQQDLRNLLPWDQGSVGSTGSGSQWSFTLLFYTGAQLHEIQFLGERLVVVFSGDGSRIYHATNPETLTALVEYLQTHGEKK